MIRAGYVMVLALVAAVVAVVGLSGGASAEAARGGDTRLKDGCWRADPSHFVQIQHGKYANDAAGDSIPTGRSLVGKPNYWGDGTHGDLGPPNGRCSSPDYPNDKYAVDYPLNRGDAIFSPFRSGRVMFAGRSDRVVHEGYGIFVVVKADNGRYVSLSAHLSGIPNGLSRGDRVTENKIIGYAGTTGNAGLGVHLHQAFYRNPSFHPGGEPYGGAGLKVDRLRYTHGGGGVYSYGWKRSPGIKAEGSLVGY